MIRVYIELDENNNHLAIQNIVRQLIRISKLYWLVKRRFFFDTPTNIRFAGTM